MKQWQFKTTIADYEIENRINLTALGITAGLVAINNTIDVNETVDIVRDNIREMIENLGTEIETP